MADIIKNDLQQEFKQTIEQGMGANFIEFPPHKKELPTHYNLDRFGENKDIAETTIAVLTHFIDAPLIVDKFEEHEEREKTRFTLFDKIADKYGKETAHEFDNILTNNKLKRNVVGNILSGVFLFSDFIQELPQKSEIEQIITTQVKTQTEIDPKTGKEKITKDPWAEKSLDQKKAILERLTDLSIDALHEIAKA